MQDTPCEVSKDGGIAHDFLGGSGWAIRHWSPAHLAQGDHMVFCAQNQLSSLARAAGKSLFHGREVMIAMKAFCDGSGSADTSPFVVLAGVTAEESEWAFFEKEWNLLLHDRFPVAPYLHMKEIVHGKGPFKDEKGWDDTKRVQLVQDCLVFSQKLDKKKFCTFVCSIDMRLYRHIRDKGYKLPSMPRICNKFVPQSIFKWYLDKFNQWERAEIYYAFDQNERFLGPFRTLVLKNQRRSWAGLYNHWDVIKEMIPANMRNALPLQLADMIAWAHHRRLTPHREGLEWSRLSEITDKIHPFYRKEIGKNELVAIAKYLSIGSVVDDYFDSLTFPPPNLPELPEGVVGQIPAV